MGAITVCLAYFVVENTGTVNNRACTDYIYV